MRYYSLREIVEALDSVKNMPYALYADAKERALKTAMSNPDYAWLLPKLKKQVEEYSHTPISAGTYQQYAAWDRRGERDADGPMYALRTRLNRMWMAALLGIEGGKEQCEDILYEFLHLPTWSLTAHLLEHGTEDYWDIPVGPYDEAGRIRGTGRNRKQSLDLCSCSAAAILAEMTQTLEGVIDPCLIRWARQECFERVLGNFMSLAPYPHFEINPNNWSGVCMSSIGIAAIYLITDTHTLAPLIMRVLESLRVHESGYNDDGASPEGFGYWQYGFEYYLMFMDLLMIRTCGKIDLLADEKVRRIARFGSDCCFGKTIKLPFGDCNWRAVLDEAVRRYIGASNISVMPQGDTEASYDFAWEHGNLMLRHLVWNMQPPEESTALPHSTVYPDSELYMASCLSGLNVAIKGGNNGESHNHNDVGTFVLIKDDKMVLVDSNDAKYSRDYFNPAIRYTYFGTRSGGHSFPIVDGMEQEGKGSCRAKSFAVKQDNSVDEIVIDLTGTLLTPKLGAFTRRFTVDKILGRIELTDTLELLSSTEIRDRLIIADEPHEISEGKLAVGCIKVEYNPSVVHYEVNPKEHFVDGDRRIYTLDFIPNTQVAGKNEITIALIDD